MENKKRVLIDLDGVLNCYGREGFDENIIPDIKSGAKEFIRNLASDYELYLFTSRNLMKAVKWLVKNDLDKYFRDVTNIKIPSYLFIDDRAVCFRGNYEKTLEDVKTFDVYWSKSRN